MTDLAQEHAAAWRYYHLIGMPPKPRGLLVWEASGLNAESHPSLFLEPSSSASRLLKYSGVDSTNWLGKLVQMNLCDGAWSARRALAGRARALAFLFDEVNFYDGVPLRVLLIGTRAASAWGCRGSFGYEEHQYGLNPIATSRVVPSDKTLHVAWIPHPSGRDSFYKSRRNQLRARRAVLWAIGERDTP